MSRTLCRLKFCSSAAAALITPTAWVSAAPDATDDSYTLFEDQPFTATSGPLFDEDFDGGGAPIAGRFDGAWDYLDRIENSNGRGDGYPVDSENRPWNHPLFEIASSSIIGWQSGDTPLQAGGIGGFPGAPDVLFGIGAADNGDNLVTTYLFRNQFTLAANEVDLANWELRYLIDDGAAVYINGSEVYRTPNLTADPLTAGTFADASLGSETTYRTAALDLDGLLVEGTNHIAVEVHQASIGSSDIGFDLALAGTAQSSLRFLADPLPAPFDTNAPGFASGDIDLDGGFEGAGAHVRVGGGPRFQDTVSSGAWRLPIALANPSTIDVSFRYRLVANSGYENGEDAFALFAVDGQLRGANGQAYLVRLDGDGNGGGDQDTGWVQFSTQLALDTGLHTLDFAVYNSGSSTPSEITDIWFDDIIVAFAGGGTSGGVLTNDSGDSATLTASLASGPGHGQLTLNPDGTFTYAPDANFFGEDQFTYTAVDASGESPEATVTLLVSEVNDRPTAGHREHLVGEDGRLDVAAVFGLVVNSDDVEGDPLTFSLAEGATSGTAVVNADGSFSYTPDPEFSGDDQFTFTASDGGSTSDPGTISLTVTPVNDPPTAADDSYLTMENVALRVSQSGAPAALTVLEENFAASAGNAFTGVTNIENSGGFASLPGFADGFLRNRTSGDPADTTVIRIDNLPPHNRVSLGFVLAIIDSWDGDQGDLFNVRVDGLTVFTEAFENSGQGGVQSYDPPPGGALARQVDLGFSTGSENLDSAYDMRLEASLQEIPHSADSITIELFASGSDWDGGDDESWAVDGFVVSVIDSGNDDLVRAGSVWKYLDDGSDLGTAWRAPGFDDSAWESGAAELGYGDGNEVTVLGFGPDEDNKYATTYFRRQFHVDNPASIETLDLGIRRDDGAAIYLNGIEIVRENLIAGAAFDDYANGNTSSETNFFEHSIEPSLLVAGENTIAVEIHQDDQFSSDISFDLWLRARRERVFGVAHNDADIDSSGLAVTLLDPPSHGAIELATTGSFLYSPDLNFEGEDSFSYMISDGEFSDTATVTISVAPGANDLPETIGDSYSTQEDTALQVGAIAGLLANDRDPEGAGLTVSLASLPANGTVVMAPDGSFTYQPAPDFNGIDPFTYRANDGTGDSPPTAVTINVSARNDQPAANPDTYLVQPGATLSVDAPGLLANDIDIDGDVLTAALVTPPAVGAAFLPPNGSLFYLPPPGFAGSVTLTYRAEDSALQSPPTAVTIYVNGAPDPVADSYSADEDRPLIVTAADGPLRNDRDPEDDPLTAVLVAAPAHGTIELAPDGAFSYRPDPNYHGIDSFFYRAADALQSSAPVAVTVIVSAVDDPPVAGADRYLVLLGQDVSVDAVSGVLANDSDIDGDTLTAVLGRDVAIGQLDLKPDGSFTYDAVPGYTGITQFSYFALAAGQRSAETTVELVVGLAADSVLINEIMFNPADGNEAAEYIELHNVGAGPVPLGDWTFTSGVSFAFPDYVLPAGGHVVIAADPAVFAQTYGALPNVIGPWTGRLSDRGERVRIRDSFGFEVDDITYSDQGDWARRRAEEDGGEDGWVWDNPADGGGASLELVNPTLSNKHGQNWTFSEGAPTPGAANSRFSRSTPPIVLDVTHRPAIPRPGQAVTVSADLKDNDGAQLQATLHWRVSTMDPDPFVAAPMFDDGLHGDGDAEDGTFGAQVPGADDGSVVEFYIEAGDGTSTRTWPASSEGEGNRGANALFQFDAEEYDGNQPIYRLVMTVREDEEFLFANHNSGSDAQKNTTLIARQGDDVDIRYLCGLRVRGAGSRSRNPRNNRLNIPRDNPWNGATRINLNTQFIYLQLLGSKLANASGVEAADAKPVQLRHNGVNHATDAQNARRYGSYLHLEPIGGEWAELHYPDDPDGNIYSKGRPDRKWIVRNFELEDGTIVPNIGGYLADGWSKGSNASQNDWTDLHELFITMGAADNPGYLDQIAAQVDVDQWARWFAYMTVVLSRETNLSNGTDDDYKMYRGSNDPRFKLIPHDFDTIFGLGDTSTNPDATLFPPITNFAGETMPQLVPFFEDPDICRIYYAYLDELLTTVFAKTPFDATVFNCLDWVPSGSGVHGEIISFMDARRAHILSRIPRVFSATSTLDTQNGLFRSDEATTADIGGTLDGTRTKTILVAGQPAALDVRRGTWEATTPVALQPGINRVPVRALDPTGAEIWGDSVTIWFDTGAVTLVSGTLAGETAWTAAGGPYLVNGDIIVPAGATLTIEPGTTVYFADGRRMTVHGRLFAKGTPTSRITFAGQAGGGWDGVYFEDSVEDNRMSYLDMDGSDAAEHSIEVDSSRLAIDHMSWSGTTETILELDRPQLIVTNSAFPGTDGNEVIHGSNLSGDDYFTLRGNTFAPASGYNDIIDFAGGRRPGPIIYVIDNLFTGASDDVLDFDGTDAHIEGNIFLNVHTDDPDRPSISSAIATDNGSHLTIVRNLFVDVDHVLLLKENADALFENNTVVGATIGAINFDEPERAGFVPGDGVTLRGNIFSDVATLFVNQFATEPGEEDPVIVADYNLMPAEHHGLGTGNIDGDPLFHTPAAGDYSLAPVSPAIGAGVNGADMGHSAPQGASISGEPPALTRSTSAQLRVHMPGISGIEGGASFVTEYRFRLDDGLWSPPQPIAEPIALAGLARGLHRVAVVGKDSAGVWQSQSEATLSRSWTVEPGLSRLVISEVLAANGGAVNHEGSFPDFIELWNDSIFARDLSGMVLNDLPLRPTGWSFPQGTMIPADGRLVVYATDPDGRSGLYTGFGLDDDGEGVFLFARSADGGGLIDSVEFGFQLPRRAIARTGQGQEWSLATPTPGSENGDAIATGSPASLAINEWLATNGIVYDNDFLELYNPSGTAVALGGLTLTDDPNNKPGLHRIAPLSFIGAGGFVKFIADGDPEQGPSHLSFRLSKLLERVGLFDSDGAPIDRVQFANGIDDTSGGRSPDGAAGFAEFAVPTPGFSNATDLSSETLVLQSLRITELAYHPFPGSAHEFVKLQNVGSEPIELGDVQFDEGISFAFPAVSLAPGESAYVASNSEVFRQIYGDGLNLLGAYVGQLSNGGERLRLEIASLGAGILDFEYDDDWYPETDGGGPSLIVVDPLAAVSAWSEASNWRPSVDADAQTYDEWVVANFAEPAAGITGKADNPDRDAIPNLLEYVFLLDPNTADRDYALPQVRVDGELLSITYTTAILPPDVVITPQLSADLADWQNATPAMVSVELLSDNGISRIYRATLNEPVAGTGHFMRLHVECE